MAEATLVGTPARAARVSTPRLERIAGIAAVTFAAVVGAHNVLLGSMSPPRGDATVGEIAEFFAGNETGLAIVTGMVPFAVVALAVFVAGAYPRLSRGSTEAGLWARVGALGAGLVAAMFLGTMIFQTALIAGAEQLAEQPGMTEALWHLREAAFGMTGLVLSVTLLGLSRAGRLSGLLPAWQEALGLAAALGFFVAAVGLVPAVGGSPIGLLGFASFVAWLAWLAMTGVRLLRTEDATA